MQENLWTLLLSMVILPTIVNSANILGVFPMPSISHQKTFLNLGKELSLRGHQVTLITTNPMNNKSLTNLTEIDINHVYNILKDHSLAEALAGDHSAMESVFNFRIMGKKMTETVFTTDAVQDLIRSNKHFDLVIIEPHETTFFAFGARYKVPVIAMSSMGVMPEMHYALGNPNHPFLAPEILLPFCGSTEATFFERMGGLYFKISYWIIYRWILIPEKDMIVKKYFGNDSPYLGDILSQISLLMITSNTLLDTPRPNIPTVVHLEQMHIVKTKPIPEDLKLFLDSSKHGCVYFSLGTNVELKTLKTDSIKTIINALALLPYNVLLKSDIDDIPGLSNNILIRKWFPQQDLLGHHNVKVFVTQGGIQSIEEAVTKGVPMVGIPFLADQPKNIKKLVDWGIALKIDPSELTVETLRDSILTVATNSSFKKNILKCKNILEDQPLKGVDKAIWWIEYVLRHNGTQHLRYPGADIPLFKYLMIDVISFVILVTLFFVYIVFKLISLLRKKISLKTKND